MNRNNNNDYYSSIPDCDGVELLNIPLNSLEWKYKNEGGENIIIYYCGNINTQLIGKVLRIRKKRNKAHSGILESYLFKKNIFSNYFSNLHYMSALGLPIQLNREFLISINEKIKNNRPLYRRIDPIDIESKMGLLMPDLTVLPYIEKPIFTKNIHSITVDIKPKCGVLPISPHIKEINSCKYLTCRYCMHQYLKFQQNNLSKISNYCPIDFFSGIKEKIFQAICNMLESPQNNIKIYSDGKLIFAEHITNDDGYEEKSNIEDLIKSLSEIFVLNNKYNSLEILVKLLVNIFTQEPLLKILKKLQQLDKLDIEAIYYLQKKFKSLQIDEDLEKNLRNIEFLDNLSIEEINKNIKDFLLAATAKDLSIMVTIFPLNEDLLPNQNYPFPIISIEEYNFPIMYRIGLVDIDPKSPENIESYYLLDQQIIQEWKKNIYKKYCGNFNL